MSDVLRHLLFSAIKGVIDMSKIMEDLLKELYEEELLDIAKKILADKSMSEEQIVEYFGLDLEEVRELVQQ